MHFSRRTFLKKSAVLGVGASINFSAALPFEENPIRIGIIGLDTSHAVAFTKLFNATTPKKEFEGFSVVSAYPFGSRDIPSSAERIPGYSEAVREWGVTIANSIEELLEEVDVVLLETNDGTMHLEQARKVFKAKKPVFIDKPVAARYDDVKKIYEEATDQGIPIFSASSLRYQSNVNAVRNEDKIGTVLGCDAFSPAETEPSHTDLFWYGIHGVEILFSIMGAGCKSVQRIASPEVDLVVGKWHDGRIGTFRGMRNGIHDYGGTAFGTEGNLNLGSFDGYEGLAKEIANFFRTKISPVDYKETLEIYAFMEAADLSKRKEGVEVLCRI
ncbi:Gfo/Idh/MocA family protein [Algoriphagus sp. Y33]|uniref:Gfo/Idh/MocA family protein n=1 Tax=Algoriphagus sp. Y33 TaxID=2772483 RepID=UPI00178535C4|nr:Gfo/Idh/MocA family oxidoreductase [Algoriphagus sp. Y33]